MACSLPEKAGTAFGATTPLGQAAPPAELAPAYARLASDAAGDITGSEYGVTGGMFMAQAGSVQPGLLSGMRE
jgi:NAD(P)-dependent dehydrogenase (short-subunit alcohol dehydrogenase family)